MMNNMFEHIIKTFINVAVSCSCCAVYATRGVPKTLSESTRAVLKDLIENRLSNQRSMNALSTRGSYISF